MIFDPVCGMAIDKQTAKYRTRHKAKAYYFCSSTCKKDFEASPEKFIKEKPIVKLEDVWKIYWLGKVRVYALRGVSLAIAPGSFVAIMGASGSGKSTLLNAVGCLDVPSKGKVFLEDQDISKLSESNLAQIRGKKVGFVFQQFNLMPAFSALENVMLPMAFQGISVEQRVKRAKALLTSVGLGKRILHRPTELAGGEQQRVAIARALANDPDIILADEPTGNLDSTTGKKIMNILISLHRKERKTIVVVTHDPYIAAYAEKLFNFKDGRVVKNHEVAKKSLWTAKTKAKI